MASWSFHWEQTMHRDERVTSVLLQACAPVNEKKNAVRMKARPLWCLPACKAQFKPFRTPPTPQTKLALAWGGDPGVCMETNLGLSLSVTLQGEGMHIQSPTCVVLSRVVPDQSPSTHPSNHIMSYWDAALYSTLTVPALLQWKRSCRGSIDGLLCVEVWSLSETLLLDQLRPSRLQSLLQLRRL